MKIKYHGHSCVEISSNNYTIVLDPYKGVDGFKDISLKANEVICSHHHLDHAYTDEIEIEKKESPFIVKTLSCFHDHEGGEKRGTNNIAVLMAEGKKIAHLGDLGHPLTKELIDELQNLDVLMIPVGGFYTIDKYEASEIVKQLNPKYVIPMHYSDKNKGLNVLSSVEEFIELIDEYKDKLLLVKGYEKEIEI